MCKIEQLLRSGELVSSGFVPYYKRVFHHNITRGASSPPGPWREPCVTFTGTGGQLVRAHIPHSMLSSLLARAHSLPAPHSLASYAPTQPRALSEYSIPTTVKLSTLAHAQQYQISSASMNSASSTMFQHSPQSTSCLHRRWRPRCKASSFAHRTQVIMIWASRH